MLLIALWAVVGGAAEPAWRLDLEAPGAHVVAAGEGRAVAWVPGQILGIALADGVVDWRRELPEASRGDLFRPVPFSPFVLLSVVVAGPDRFEVIDARSGEAVWVGAPSEVALGAWASPDGADLLVLTDRVDAPGEFGLVRVSGGATHRIDDALRAPPPIVPARPGPTGTYSARGAPLPCFVDGDVITAWAPLDGVTRRGPDGAVRWRVLLPGAEEVSPLSGFADPVHGPRGLVLPLRPRQLTLLDVESGLPLWRGGRGRTKMDVAHLAVGAAGVVVAGADRVALLAADDGKPVWSARTGAVVVDVALGAHALTVDEGGEVVAWNLEDGRAAWRFSVDVEASPAGVVALDGGWVVTLDRGAIGLGSDGAVRWRHTEASRRPAGADPLGVAARGRREAQWRAALDRESPPAEHPAAAEHVWVASEAAAGRAQAVLHRVDLRTGEVGSVPIGSPQARWLWDAATRTVVRLDAGGALEAIRLP